MLPRARPNALRSQYISEKNLSLFRYNQKQDPDLRISSSFALALWEKHFPHLKAKKYIALGHCVICNVVHEAKNNPDMDPLEKEQIMVIIGE